MTGQIKVACILLLLWWFLTPAMAAEKIALVIGNSDYEHIDKLKNPVNDATAVAQSLKKLGFKIFRPASQKRDALLNLNQNEIFDAINGFREAAKGADIALVYYAGHGAQLDGKREAYILPVDVPDPTNQSKLRLMAKRSVSISEIMEDLSGQARLTVAIFDACRNIPKIASLTRGLNRSDYLGLAKPSQVRKGQIVAYAGAAGELVPDGIGQRHSPYTQQFLESLKKKPQQEVGNFFRSLAVTLEKKGLTQQEPELVIKTVPPNTNYFLGNGEQANQIIPQFEITKEWYRLRDNNRKLKVFFDAHVGEIVFINGGIDAGNAFYQEAFNDKCYGEDEDGFVFNSKINGKEFIMPLTTLAEDLYLRDLSYEKLSEFIDCMSTSIKFKLLKKTSIDFSSGGTGIWQIDSVNRFFEIQRSMVGFRTTYSLEEVDIPAHIRQVYIKKAGKQTKPEPVSNQQDNSRIQNSHSHPAVPGCTRSVKHEHPHKDGPNHKHTYNCGK